jgi:transcriptional regulator with XRE-family HTH domain
MKSQIDTIREQQAERLELVRKQTGMKQIEFAQYLDLQPTSYSDIKRAKNGISRNIMQKLERKLNVNIDWLLTGNGEMMAPENGKYQPTKVMEMITPYKTQPTEGVTNYIDKLFKIIERRDDQIERLLTSNQEKDVLISGELRKIVDLLNNLKISV